MQKKKKENAITFRGKMKKLKEIDAVQFVPVNFYWLNILPKIFLYISIVAFSMSKPLSLVLETSFYRIWIYNFENQIALMKNSRIYRYYEDTDTRRNSSLKRGQIIFSFEIVDTFFPAGCYIIDGGFEFEMRDLKTRDRVAYTLTQFPMMIA